MDYRKLGRSGVMVSPLCLGAMNFGGPTSADESFQIMRRALEVGQAVGQMAQERGLTASQLALPCWTKNLMTRTAHASMRWFTPAPP